MASGSSRIAVAKAACGSALSPPLSLKRRFRLRRQAEFQSAFAGKRIYSGRALDLPAHGDTDTVLFSCAGDSKRDQAAAAEDTLPANRSLELALPAKAVTPLHRGGAIRRSAGGGPYDAGSAPHARRHARSSGAENHARDDGIVSWVERFA